MKYLSLPLRSYFLLVASLLVFTTCDTEDDSSDILPFEERVANAISNLEQLLVAPANGWRVEYQPESGGGVFFMLLDFNENGEVTIQSDVSANDGEFFQHTIPYRIDNALGLELIFETYGVFHYLFELESSTFGAEFELLFQNDTEGNLVFRSATDVGIPSQIIFEPADASDVNRFSRDVAQNLESFATISPQFIEPKSPKLKITFEEQGVSLFATLDPTRRIIDFIFIGTGNSAEEVLEGGNFEPLDFSTGYSFQNGNMVLASPLSLSGGQVTINEIALSAFEQTGSNFCDLTPSDGPKYTGSISGLGAISMEASLFDPTGLSFQPIENSFYAVNSFFVLDNGGNSLEPAILQAFPEVVAFAFFYGFDNTSFPEGSPYENVPTHAVGFLASNDDGLYVILREFEPTTTQGTRVNVKLTDNYILPVGATATDEQNLAAITDVLFAGENVYADVLLSQGPNIFRLYNPCNQIEMFLVL